MGFVEAASWRSCNAKSSTVGLSTAVTVASVSAYFLRFKARCFYGLLEIFVDMTASMIGLRKLALRLLRHQPDLTTATFSFAAGIYIIVRGMLNFHDGIRVART